MTTIYVKSMNFSLKVYKKAKVAKKWFSSEIPGFRISDEKG